MTREVLGSTTAGLDEISEPTWWANRNPGLRYVRCELPARRLGGHVDFLGDAVKENRLDVHTGVQVIQLAATRDQFDLIQAFRKRGQDVFVEFDDDYTRWDEHGRNVRGQRWEKHDRDTPDRWSPSVEMARACAKEATGVIVTTQHLKRVYGELTPNVTVCQNSVEPADWPAWKERTDGSFRVVFAGAPHGPDMVKIRKAMEWVASRPDGEAVLVGADPGWTGVRSVPWVNDLALLREFMVGLAPDVGLRPFEPTRFAQGKSDLKILEYSMAGALSIVGPGEPYKNWEGLAWFAKSSNDFLYRVQMAYENREMARAVAVMAREVTLTSRTIELEAHVWSSAFLSSSASHKRSA